MQRMQPRTISPAPCVQFEKDWNQTLNVWMRCPFCCITTFILIGGLFTHPEMFSGPFDGKVQMFVQLANVLHCGWNGCFFMYRTVDARSRFEEKRKAAKAEGSKSL